MVTELPDGVIVLFYGHSGQCTDNIKTAVRRQMLQLSGKNMREIAKPGEKSEKVTAIRKTVRICLLQQ